MTLGFLILVVLVVIAILVFLELGALPGTVGISLHPDR